MMSQTTVPLQPTMGVAQARGRASTGDAVMVLLPTKTHPMHHVTSKGAWLGCRCVPTICLSVVVEPPEEDDGDVMATACLLPLLKQLLQKPSHCLIEEEFTCRDGETDREAD